MKRIALAMLTLAVVASPASAQVWNTFTPANGGAGYWNNTSDDNATVNDICNVGNVLTNAALTPANCINETPSSLLPANRFNSGAGGGAFLNGASGFLFGPGTWTIDIIGQMAGAVPTTWGIYNVDGQTFTTYSGGTLTVTTTTRFGLWIDTFDPSTQPNRYLSSGAICTQANPYTVGGSCSASGTQQQHAVFNPNSGLNGTTIGMDVTSFPGYGILQSGLYYVGMEDNATQGSDFDYNDVILQVSAVPEPSTYALMATGLVAIFGMARRRKA